MVSSVCLYLRAVSVVWVVCAAGVSPHTLGDTEGGDRRVIARTAQLSGEDKVRVEELEKKIQELREQGTYADAIPFAEDVLEIRERVQGASHWGTGDARRLIETLKRIASLHLEAQAELADADRSDSVIEQLFAQAKYNDGIELAERQLVVRRRLLGAEHLDVATSANVLAVLLERTGNYTAAEPLNRKAVAICRKLLGDGHPDLATSLVNLAALLKSKGDYAEAEPLYREALDIYRELPGKVHLHLPVAMNNLANLHLAQGDYWAAEPLFREALRMRRKLLGDAHPSVATGMNNLAVLLQHQGKHGAAEPLQREALQIFRRAYGDEHPEVGRSLGHLAGILKDQGNVELAERLYREAVAIKRVALGSQHRDVARTLNNLALLVQGRGDYASAESLYHEALKMLRDAFGDRHSEVATALNNLAILHAEQGNYEKSESMYHEVLAIERAVLGNEHPAVARTSHNLARLALRRGNLAEAERLFRKAVAMRRQLPNHRSLASSLTLLADALHALGQYSEAESTLAEASHSFESGRLQISSHGMGRIQYAAERSPLGRLAACLARNGKPALAWQRFEANLARGVLDTLSAQAVRALDDAERDREQRLINELNRLEEQLAALSTSEDGSDQARAESKDLRTEQEKVQAEFARFEAKLVAKYGAAAGDVFALARIQHHLPADAALLGWVDIRGNPDAADSNGEHWASVVRRQGAPVWIKLPGSGAGDAWTEEDNSLPSQLRRALGERPSRRVIKWPGLVRRLHAQRIAPVEPHLAGVRHLIVLPAGWMCGVPIEAITDKYTISYAPSGTMYAWLVDKQQPSKDEENQVDVARLLALGDPIFPQPEESITPTPDPPDHGVLIAMVAPDSNAAKSGLRQGDVLLSYDGSRLGGAPELGPAIRQAASAAATRGDPAGVLVSVWRNGQVLKLAVAPGKLGVRPSRRPVAEARHARRDLDVALHRTRSSTLAPLPGTRREVQAIADLFERTGRDSQPTVLLGSEASEQNLHSLATTAKFARFRFLHFATHGFIDDQAAMRSALVLSQHEATSQLEAVLAGTEVYDGRLTANQIVRSWKLDADLVTLSACETALGKASGGEGFLGFAQAFFVAGARSLVLSLWKVDDVATTLLMTRFYENLLGAFEESRELPGRLFLPGEAISKAEALREAKLWLRRSPQDEIAAALDALDLEPSPPNSSTTRAKLDGERPRRPAGEREYDFSDPYYWAAFILIGNPD